MHACWRIREHQKSLRRFCDAMFPHQMSAMLPIMCTNPHKLCHHMINFTQICERGSLHGDWYSIGYLQSSYNLCEHF